MGVAAELIREARQAAGLTMAELAERAGSSKPTISRYENGLVDPGVETLNRLLHACGRELRAQPVGLPASREAIGHRFEAQEGPTADDVTRTNDGRELRTAADLEAFAAELRDEGLLAT
ncbi:MAG: helix-turn-helix transcriptional regulator [Ilumatobacteraceae bacterium]|nr:helix-turn-helix transcriptional regulator [Ilumatobacteraceae bacterium]